VNAHTPDPSTAAAVHVLKAGRLVDVIAGKVLTNQVIVIRGSIATARVHSMSVIFSLCPPRSRRSVGKAAPVSG
jgi:hypothetical protein